MYHLTQTDSRRRNRLEIPSHLNVARATAFSPRPENRKGQVLWRQDPRTSNEIFGRAHAFGFRQARVEVGQLTSGVFRRDSENSSEWIRWAAGFGTEMEVDLREAVLHNRTWGEENHVETPPRHGTRDRNDKVAAHTHPAPSARPHATSAAMMCIITRHGLCSSLEGSYAVSLHPSLR
jgi:hypothetical protein